MNQKISNDVKMILRIPELICTYRVRKGITKKMNMDEIIEELVYAIFDGKISLDEPEQTINQCKAYLEKTK